MNMPLAVSPTNPNPGLHLRVALVRGAQAAGIAGLRALIITPPTTGLSGGATLDNEIRTVTSEDDVKTASGRSLGYLAYRKLVKIDKNAQVDLIVCTGSAGAVASQTLTLGGAPTSNMVWELDAQGKVFSLDWPVGMSQSDAAASWVARLNAKADEIYFSAASLAEVLTMTARAAGPAGNDVKLTLKLISGAGGTATLGGSALAGGTTEVDMTAALATAAVREYDYILPCMSHTEAVSASASTNSGRLVTHIDALLTGLNAKLQQGIYGSTGTRSAAATNTLARNHTNLQHVNFQNSRDLPCEVAAAELADRMRRRRLESNANRVRQPLRVLSGALDWQSNVPTDTQFQAAADAGVSVISYDANGIPISVRAITTYSKDGTGAQDRRAFDVNEIDAIYDYVKDLRSAIPQEFQTPDQQVKVMRDRVEGDDPLPELTVEERDIKAFIEARTLGFWVPKGVVHGPRFVEAVANGELRVEVNDSDETQVDIFLPVKILKIAAKFGLYVAKEN